MSVLIHDMEIPQKCMDCKLTTNDRSPKECVFRRWKTLSVNDTPQKSEWCPLRKA